MILYKKSLQLKTNKILFPNVSIYFLNFVYHQNMKCCVTLLNFTCICIFYDSYIFLNMKMLDSFTSEITFKLRLHRISRMTTSHSLSSVLISKIY